MTKIFNKKALSNRNYSINPCQNGATCITLSSSLGYYCLCTLGFTGKNCETSKYFKILIFNQKSN